MRSKSCSSFFPQKVLFVILLLCNVAASRSLTKTIPYPLIYNPNEAKNETRIFVNNVAQLQTPQILYRPPTQKFDLQKPPFTSPVIQPNFQYIDLSKSEPILYPEAAPHLVDKVFKLFKNNCDGISSCPSRRYLVIGGGPIGMYLAYSLLKKDKKAFVSVLEKRGFNRPQVITIPFIIAKKLPSALKKRLWPDSKTRSRIFRRPVCGPLFWPSVGYEQWSFINIQTFQIEFLRYLRVFSHFKQRFSFFEKEFDPNTFDINETSDLFPKTEGARLDAIFCTCGLFSQTFRKEPELAMTKEEPKGHGIYWTYHNREKETYCRNGKEVKSSEVWESGIVYAASNNKINSVQIYTRPYATLKTLFDSIPDEIIKRASYASKINPLTTGYNPDLSKEATMWFNKYVAEVKSILFSHDIPYPHDPYDINVYYAARKEYYFIRVTTRLEVKSSQHKIPLFFVGDSAGSTDYTWGLSGSRGLLAADYIGENLYEGVEGVLLKYQKYWTNVIATEFDKDIKVTSKPFLKYKYSIKGRAPYFSDSDFTYYLREHNRYFNITKSD